MAHYRVSKINSSHSPIEYTKFDAQDPAETFAKQESLKHTVYSYAVEKKRAEEDDDDYQTVVIFKDGQEIVRFTDVSQK